MFVRSNIYRTCSKNQFYRNLVVVFLVADSVHKLSKGFTIKAVFSDAAHLEPLKQSLEKAVSPPTLVVTTDPADKVFQALAHTGEHFRMYEVADATRHVPMMFFSSGTTGDPKGVLISDTYVQMCGH